MNKSMMYRKLIDQFGKDEYLFKVVEELGELIVAVTHFRLGKVDDVALASEMADVMIQLEKLFEIAPSLHELYLYEYQAKIKKLKIITDSN